jgi:hypothetical protein
MRVAPIDVIVITDDEIALANTYLAKEIAIFFRIDINSKFKIFIAIDIL